MQDSMTQNLCAGQKHRTSIQDNKTSMQDMSQNVYTGQHNTTSKRHNVTHNFYTGQDFCAGQHDTKLLYRTAQHSSSIQDKKTITQNNLTQNSAQDSTTHKFCTEQHNT